MRAHLISALFLVTGCLDEQTDSFSGQPIDVRNSVATCDVTNITTNVTGGTIVKLMIFPREKEEHEGCRDRDGNSIKCPDFIVGLINELDEVDDEFRGEGDLKEDGTGTVTTFDYERGEEALLIRGDQTGGLTISGVSGSFTVNRASVVSEETYAFSNCAWAPKRADLQYEYVLTTDIRRPGQTTPIKRQHSLFVVTLFANQLLGFNYVCSMTVEGRAYEAILTQNVAGGPFVYKLGSRDLTSGAIFRDETQADELRDLDHDVRVNDTTHRARLAVASESKWRERTPPDERNGFFPDVAFFLSQVPAAPSTRGQITCKTEAKP